MCVIDRHDMTLAVEVALTTNTTSQSNFVKGVHAITLSGSSSDVFCRTCRVKDISILVLRQFSISFKPVSSLFFEDNSYTFMLNVAPTGWKAAMFTMDRQCMLCFIVFVVVVSGRGQIP